MMTHTIRLRFGHPILKLAGACACGAFLMLSGCAERDIREGVIVSENAPFGVGSPAPNATFVDSEGEYHRVSSVYDDVTLIAFVGDACSDRDPTIVENLEDLPPNVTAVEICMGPCASHDECTQMRSGEDSELVVLCDARGVLTRLYRVERPGAVFVVDGRGEIVAAGSLSKLEDLRSKAVEVAREAERERMERELY